MQFRSARDIGLRHIIIWWVGALKFLAAHLSLTYGIAVTGVQVAFIGVWTGYFRLSTIGVGLEVLDVSLSL